MAKSLVTVDQTSPGSVYPESKLEVYYCNYTEDLRHVVSIGLIWTMGGLFRATGSRVTQTFVCE